MDLTFNKLVARSTTKLQSKVGDPWEVIPIKNRKQARDSIEIHLANRGVEVLSQFENFPNLEVLYLNNNQLAKLEGLDENFRIKHLYLFSNKLKNLDGSLEFLSHIETLLLYKNELRDLDVVLGKLQHLRNLKQLDLFENPLAEEPNYRLRVIYSLPSIQILDRHSVTQVERIKAKKFIEEDSTYHKNSNEKTIRRIRPSSQFSKGEKNISQEAKEIKLRRLEEARQLKEKIAFASAAKNIIWDSSKVPLGKEKQEMEIRKKEDPLSLITEWDKSRLKPIFKQFDKDKKGVIPLEKLPELYDLISADTNFVGKVPDCSKEEFIQLLTPQTELAEAGAEQKAPPSTLSWDDFRFNLNKFYWKKPDLNATSARIKDLYYQANKKIFSGDLPAAKEFLYKAVKVESQLGATETNKVLLMKTEKAEKMNPRVDSFDFGKYTFRKEFSLTAKISL